MIKKTFKPILTLFITLSVLCLSMFSTLTASAAWYQHVTPATVTTSSSLTSPARTYDGNYMAIELTVQSLPSNVTSPAGLIVQPIINGSPGNRYYINFKSSNYYKLDMIPIPNNASVCFRYQVYGTNLSSVTLTRVVTYSWSQ